MKLIQLRGANACGKSTTVRQWIDRGNFVTARIKVKSKLYPYMYDKQRNVAITGEYKGINADGIDGVITNKWVMLDYITKIITTVKPKVIVFEGLVYGLTTLFALQLNNLAQAYGYEYKAILLHLPFEVQAERLLQRNNGKQVDYDALLQKYNNSHRSVKKLRAHNIDAEIIDVSKISLAEMYKVLENEIN